MDKKETKIVQLSDAQMKIGKAFLPLADATELGEMFPAEDIGAGTAVPPVSELPPVEVKKEEKIVMDPKAAVEAIKALIAAEDIDKAVKKQGEEMIASLEELIKAQEAAQEFLDKNKPKEVPPTLS